MRAPSMALLSALAAICYASPFDIERRGCGNNCARAVIAGSFPNRPTKADCSSFVAVTVTPATVTYTATVSDIETHTATYLQTVTDVHHTTQTDVQIATVTTTVTSTQAAVVVNKRVVSSKSIPTYASACSSAAAYTDACSCIGVTAYTVTAAAPSTTVTTHVTQTVSETVSTTIHADITSTDHATVSSTVTVAVTTVVPAAPTCASPTVGTPPIACVSGGAYAYEGYTDTYFVESCYVGVSGGVKIQDATGYSLRACMGGCVVRANCVAVSFIAGANLCSLYSVAPTVGGSGIYHAALTYAAGTCPA